MPRLDITTEYTVWCGGCNHWEQFPHPNKRTAEKRWRKEGWRIRGKDTLCPECLNKTKPE
jgi:hypothetical protein